MAMAEATGRRVRCCACNGTIAFVEERVIVIQMRGRDHRHDTLEIVGELLLTCPRVVERGGRHEVCRARNLIQA